MSNPGRLGGFRCAGWNGNCGVPAARKSRCFNELGGWRANLVALHNGLVGCGALRSVYSRKRTPTEAALLPRRSLHSKVLVSRQVYRSNLDRSIGSLSGSPSRQRTGSCWYNVSRAFSKAACLNEPPSVLNCFFSSTAPPGGHSWNEPAKAPGINRYGAAPAKVSPLGSGARVKKDEFSLLMRTL